MSGPDIHGTSHLTCVRDPLFSGLKNSTTGNCGGNGIDARMSRWGSEQCKTHA